MTSTRLRSAAAIPAIICPTLMARLSTSWVPDLCGGLCFSSAFLVGVSCQIDFSWRRFFFDPPPLLPILTAPPPFARSVPCPSNILAFSASEHPSLPQDLGKQSRPVQHRIQFGEAGFAQHTRCGFLHIHTHKLALTRVISTERDQTCADSSVAS